MFVHRSDLVHRQAGIFRGKRTLMGYICTNIYAYMYVCVHFEIYIYTGMKESMSQTASAVFGEAGGMYI
jgi:hypothetical protein